MLHQDILFKLYKYIVRKIVLLYNSKDSCTLFIVTIIIKYCDIRFVVIKKLNS